MVQKEILERVAAEVKKKFKLEKLEYKLGTMIEIPRAALLADEMAEVAESHPFCGQQTGRRGHGYSGKTAAGCQ